MGNRQLRRKTARKDKKASKLYRWEMKEPSQRLREIIPSNPPNLNFPIPPVVYIGDKIEGGSLQLRVKALVENHPSEEIRIGLKQNVDNGNLSIGFQTQNSMPVIAQFMVVKAKNVVKNTSGKIKDFNLVIMIDPIQLAKNLSENDKLYFMAVLYHEYTHYKQYQKALLESGDDMKVMHHWRGRRPKTREDGIRWIQNEMEAYEKECALIASWGITPPSESLAQMMRYLYTPEFGQYIFHIHMNALPLGIPRRVIAGMAEAAGHPEPNVYL